MNILSVRISGWQQNLFLEEKWWKWNVLYSIAGSRILAQGRDNIPKDQMYPMRLKGISICFSMLKAALCGNYVNFGVFRLYGDDALDSALHTFVKLLLSIPQSDLLVSQDLIFCS